jgi:hypothetical protein
VGSANAGRVQQPAPWSSARKRNRSGGAPRARESEVLASERLVRGSHAIAVTPGFKGKPNANHVRLMSHLVLKVNRMRTMYVPGSVIHVHSDYINDSS